MSWFKIDDGFFSHPKVLEAGNEATGLYVRCGSYCSRYLTGGRIRRSIALSFGDICLIDILVKVGLLEPIEDGWLLHDYHDYNPTKEKVIAEREAAARRQAAAREKARLKREAANRKAEEENRHEGSHAVSHAVTNGGSHTDADAPSSERHGVTYAASTPRPETITVTVDQGPDSAPDIATVQSIDDAPSRRDSQQQSRAPRPDPTRPVLPTEVRKGQKPRAAVPAAEPAALFECAPAARGDEPVPQEPTLNAGTLIAEWVDYRTRSGEENKPTEEMIGRVGKELKKLLAEVSYDIVRQAFQEWDTKSGSPKAIPSFVDQVQGRRAAAGSDSNVVQLHQGRTIPGQRVSATRRAVDEAEAAGEEAKRMLAAMRAAGGSPFPQIGSGA